MNESITPRLMTAAAHQAELHLAAAITQMKASCYDQALMSIKRAFAETSTAIHWRDTMARTELQNRTNV